MAQQEAAVALVVCGTEPEEEVLLIRRSKNLSDQWSGTWALPGGRRCGQDEDLLETALRETSEECGLAFARRQLVGSLAAREAGSPGSLVLVTPFVFRLPNRPVVRLDTREAVEAHWLSLHLLREPHRHRKRCVPGQPATRLVQAFDLRPVPLWGFTYRLLCEWAGVSIEREQEELA